MNLARGAFPCPPASGMRVFLHKLLKDAGGLGKPGPEGIYRHSDTHRASIVFCESTMVLPPITARVRVVAV